MTLGVIENKLEYKVKIINDGEAGVNVMSNDISTMYTKEQNLKNGRKGYCLWKKEKVDCISPYFYGAYLIRRKKGKK